LRILESRFLGSVRRGVHGGLALRVPDMEESAELMAIYLSAIGSGRDGFWAPRNYCCRKWPTVLTPRRILRSILAALTQTFDRANSHLPARGDTRALIIARRIVADLQARPVASGGGAKLGTLTELEEIHSSGRPIILQAIRILEELEMIEMVPGRGGGIALRQPSPGAVVRALYPHFVLQNLSMETSRDIIWSINLATAAYAATHRSSRQAADLRATLDGLTARDFDTADHSGQVLIWRMLGDVAGNKVLHMLARCIFYFQLQSDAVALERILEPLPEVLLDYTCQLARLFAMGMS
jgi:DNA-binding FadR family transcriptional regulator